jgi:hypothetical protein
MNFRLPLSAGVALAMASYICLLAGPASAGDFQVNATFEYSTSVAGPDSLSFTYDSDSSAITSVDLTQWSDSCTVLGAQCSYTGGLTYNPDPTAGATTLYVPYLVTLADGTSLNEAVSVAFDGSVTDISGNNIGEDGIAVAAPESTAWMELFGIAGAAALFGFLRMRSRNSVLPQSSAAAV